MLRSLNDIINYVLVAEDGDFGRCKDFLFDDRLWVIRYMVADTGKWLPGRKVLISPISLGVPEWTDRKFSVNLTKARIEESPELDEDAPVSRKYEKKFFKYFHWPYYWHGGNTWGQGLYPVPEIELDAAELEREDWEDPEDIHLRSAQEVNKYHIKAKDGEIGHVEDYVINDETWIVRYLVVDTRNWLPGRKVLVSPEWIESIDWETRLVAVDLTTEAVKGSPEYNPLEPINLEYETRLYDYYGRPAYWK